MTCAILLAAGRSQRMGCQKLLLPFAGQTVVGHIARQLLASPIEHTIVVTGQDTAAVADALRQATDCPPIPSPVGDAMRGYSLVTNPDPAGDMLSSVRCGLRSLPEACQTIMVVLGDQPSITPRLIAQLLGAFPAAGRGVVVPAYNGKTGHPIIFSARYREELLLGYDEVGLRGLLQAHPDDVCELPVTDASILSDMDYPEDYQRELVRHAG